MNFFTKSFAAGEITPALYGRVDLTKYATGLRTCRNFYISRTGGAYNRPGTKFCTTAQDQTHAVRLVRFTTAAGYKYVLELGYNYIRPLDQGQPIMTAPISLVGFNPGTTTTLFLNQFGPFVVGDQVNFTLVTSAQTLSNVAAQVTAVSGANITVNYNSSSVTGTFTSGSVTLQTQRILTYPAPWTDTVLRQITFTQDGNSIIFAHQSFYPQVFTYMARQAWTFSNVSMAPKTPSPTSVTSSTSSGTVFYFGVTAIDADTFEESFVTTIGLSAPPTQNAPITINWPVVTNAVEYNVFGGTNAQSLGFRSVVYTNTFTDNGSLTTDLSDPPPIPRYFFSNPNSTLPQYPATIGLFQQRRWYGNIGPLLETIPSIIPSPVPLPAASDRMIGSRIASPTFFAINRPVGDDDPISFRFVHKDPQIIRHFLDIGKLAVFTEQGEWIVQGGDNGISPSQINPTCVSQNGSGYLQPLAIGNLAFYRQLKGSIIRTFGFEFQIEGYRGDDLTVFSKHLVDDNQILAWDFQKLPHPIVWMVRDDGTMLGLTFVPEQAIIAWHRHDFQNGFVEDVCQSDDRVYMVIRRVINGQTVRYIERLHNRKTNVITDSIFVDSSFSYYGTQTASTVTLSGGTTWANGESITITLSGATFNPASLPNAIHVTGSDGTFIRMLGLSYVSPTVLSGTPSATITSPMQGVPLAWTDARSTLSGLGYLEGQQVSVIGDGFVAASPNNPSYPVVTVTGGQVTLPQAYGIIHVGLPITADLETLNLDTAQGQTIMDKQKAITKVSMWVEQTRGLFVASVPEQSTTLLGLQGLEPTVTSFWEPKVRYSEGYSKPNMLLTRVIDQNISGAWTSHGRVLVRQVDPLPAAILGIAPGGLAPVGM